jgi:hypothetical protein
MLLQLFCAAVLMILTALIHGIGVIAIAHWLGLDRPQPKVGRLHPRNALILSAIALALLSLHLTEIALFAGFYMMVGALPDLDIALFYSASAYSTLASPRAGFPEAWQLVAALEALVGFLMIGWSTAFFVTDMNKLLRN